MCNLFARLSRLIGQVARVLIDVYKKQLIWWHSIGARNSFFHRIVKKAKLSYVIDCFGKSLIRKGRGKNLPKLNR